MRLATVFTIYKYRYNFYRKISYLCRKRMNMLEDFRLKVFMAVASEGSFTKAASVLGVSQPAVSQNVADLERMTGVKLFERLRGEVNLTKILPNVFTLYVHL